MVGRVPSSKAAGGLKFKIAHKRAGSEKWSATPRTRRKRMIMFLRSVLADLEKQTERESTTIATPETRGARKPRNARTPQAIRRRATGRQRGATRVSAQHHARRTTRVH